MRYLYIYLALSLTVYPLNCYEPISYVLKQIINNEKVSCPEGLFHVKDINFNTLFGNSINFSFIGANLSDAIMFNCYFKKINFSFANLDNAKFNNSILVNVIFDYASLNRTDFSGCTLVNIDFSKTDRPTAIFDRAIIQHSEEIAPPPPIPLFRQRIIGPLQRKRPMIRRELTPPIPPTPELENANPRNTPVDPEIELSNDDVIQEEF